MKELAAELRRAGPRLRRQLRRRVGQEARPLVRDVQQSIRDMPVRHRTGLRQTVARTVSSRLSAPKSGVRLAIVSRGSLMPPGEESLPRHLNSERGWMHPVFGGREAELTAGRHGRAWTWVRQWGKPHWFETPILADEHKLHDACQFAIDDVARDLRA